MLDPSPHFLTKDGFCRPDWQAITVLIEESVPESEWESAWEVVSRQWVDLLCRQLGGRYRVHETANFLILTEASAPIARDAAKSFEDSRRQLCHCLREISLDEGYGKHVALMFANLNDYCRYIAYFYPDGDHPMNGGVCLTGDGYVHFAFPTLDYDSYSTTLVHELTHGFLSYLPVPTWLDEALAMRMEEIICGSRNFRLNRELREKHEAHWNAETIQSFWTGMSWQTLGDSFDLSYSLAQVLWRKIEIDIGAAPGDVFRFVSLADAVDAGESACQSSLGMSLGDLVQEFLGDGKWTPNPETWPNPYKAFPRQE